MREPISEHLPNGVEIWVRGEKLKNVLNEYARVKNSLDV